MARPHAFGHDRRLRRRADFLRVQSANNRIVTRHFVFLLDRQPQDRAPAAASRLGIVTTRKLGNAVQRNRVKRLCRECFRQCPGLLPSGLDLVIIARQGADALLLDEVRSEWRQIQRLLWRRGTEALARGANMAHLLSSPAVVAPGSGQRGHGSATTKAKNGS